MKVVGLYLVRNEVDLIEVNLLHHFATVIDEAIVIDNGSTDGTLEKVASLVDMMPIQLASEIGPYDQSARVTRMARLAIQNGADWVLPIDADEFWIGTDIGLRSVLEDTPSEVSALRAEIINFVQRRDALTAGPRSLLSMTMRPRRQIGPIELCEELVESQQIGFVEIMYPPKWVSRASPNIVITNGNHSVEGIPNTTVLTDKILCLHAPLRARSLLTGKLDQGRRVIEDEGRKDYWHVRRWWRLSREGTIEDEWRANSYARGTLTVGNQRRELVVDTRLSDAVAKFVPASPSQETYASDATNPAISAYLLALDTLSGSFLSLDFRIFVELDRLEREHGVRGAFLEVGANCAKSAILLGHLARLSNDELVISDPFEHGSSIDEKDPIEKPSQHRGLIGQDFADQYMRFHDQLPAIITGTSTQVDLESLSAGFRFVHMAGSHTYDFVQKHFRVAEKLLGSGGIVAFDVAHRAGASLALWEELLSGRFMPICLTNDILYCVWGHLDIDWGSRIDDWVQRNSEVECEIHTFAGRPVWRLYTPPQVGVTKTLAHIPSFEELGTVPTTMASGTQDAEDVCSEYDGSFYDFTSEAAREAAQEIVPLVLELTSAQSVVDVGCGIGTWLSVFGLHGVDDVVGLDGPHIETASLEIPVSAFLPWDLEQPLSLPRRFDLAVCLEVAEHLSVGHADTLVNDLVRLAPIVLFSAAAPLQGGVGHVNEQWPTYWVQKFAEKGLLVIDAIRPVVWDNERVAMWYAQNCVLFATPEALDLHAPLAKARRSTNTRQLDVVHPSIFLYHRLGLSRPTARVPWDAASGWIADADSLDIAAPREPRQSPVDPTLGETPVLPPPIGLRVLFRALPAATRRALTTRWDRLRRR